MAHDKKPFVSITRPFHTSYNAIYLFFEPPLRGIDASLVARGNHNLGSFFFPDVSKCLWLLMANLGGVWYSEKCIIFSSFLRYTVTFMDIPGKRMCSCMDAETHKNQEKWRYCLTVFTFIYLSIYILKLLNNNLFYDTLFNLSRSIVFCMISIIFVQQLTINKHLTVTMDDNRTTTKKNIQGFI